MNQAHYHAPACPQQVGRGYRCEEGPNPKRRKLVSSSEEIKKDIRLCPLLDMNGRCPFGDKRNFAHLPLELGVSLFSEQMSTMCVFESDRYHWQQEASGLKKRMNNYSLCPVIKSMYHIACDQVWKQRVNY